MATIRMGFAMPGHQRRRSLLTQIQGASAEDRSLDRAPDFPGRYLALKKLDDTRVMVLNTLGFFGEGPPHEREEERKKGSGLRFNVRESVESRTISFLRHFIFGRLSLGFFLILDPSLN